MGKGRGRDGKGRKGIKRENLHGRIEWGRKEWRRWERDGKDIEGMGTYEEGWGERRISAPFQSLRCQKTGLLLYYGFKDNE